MTKTRRVVLFGLGAAVIGCAAVLAAFLTPPKFDLMARSAKVADLTGMETFQLHWLDRTRLVAAKGGWPYFTVPSMVAIDVFARTIAPLPAVNATLRRITRTHPLAMIQILPSPDGQWLLCAPGSQTFGTGGVVMCPRLIRVRDGRYLATAPVPVSFEIMWLPDSRHWMTRSYTKSNPVICSVDNPLKAQSAPAPGADWYSHVKHKDADEARDFLGAGRILVTQKSYRSKRWWDGYGVISPDRTRIAWLRQDDWLDRAPMWIRRVLFKLNYHSCDTGEIWTVRLDGTDRREVGAFGSRISPGEEIRNFDWTPDSTSLIFVRSHTLYSVPAP